MKTLTTIIIFICAITLLTSCYSGSNYRKNHISSPDILPANERGTRQTIKTFKMVTKPWEIFQHRRTLSGYNINNRFILTGDNLFAQGKKIEALNEYNKAKSFSHLSVPEYEALTLRIASLELTLDHAQNSLTILSNYFTQAKLGVNDVEAPFSIVFGYAYGRSGDTNQALAWLSRASKTANHNVVIINAAQTGVDLILRGIPDDKFNQMKKNWLNEPFINNAITKEASRRAGNLTYNGLDQSLGLNQNEIQTSSGNYQQNSSSIAVLLPLSGAYGALGNSARNGASIALDNIVNAKFLDTKGDANQATSHIRSLVSSGEHPVIIGPLLATPAASSAILANQSGLPMIALSKRSDFPISNGIFRLGTTTDSQISSLLEQVYSSLGISKFALVYQANESGNDYAKTFQNVTQRLRLNLIYEASYHTIDDASFSAISKALNDLDIEAIFFPADIDTSVKFMQSLSEELRSRIRLLGIPSLSDINKLNNSRQFMEGVIFATPFYEDSSNRLVQNFINTYLQKFGKKPDFMAAQAFDAATLAIVGLQRQAQYGNFTDALQSVSQYDGVTGKIEVRPNGELFRKLAVLEFKNGVLKELTSSTSAPMYIAR